MAPDGSEYSVRRVDRTGSATEPVASMWDKTPFARSKRYSDFTLKETSDQAVPLRYNRIRQANPVLDS